MAPRGCSTSVPWTQSHTKSPRETHFQKGSATINLRHCRTNKILRQSESTCAWYDAYDSVVLCKVCNNEGRVARNRTDPCVSYDAPMPEAFGLPRLCSISARAKAILPRHCLYHRRTIGPRQFSSTLHTKTRDVLQEKRCHVFLSPRASTRELAVAPYARPRGSTHRVRNTHTNNNGKGTHPVDLCSARGMAEHRTLLYERSLEQNFAYNANNESNPSRCNSTVGVDCR